MRKAAAGAIALAIIRTAPAEAQETEQPQATAPDEENVRGDPDPEPAPPSAPAAPVGRAAENVVTQAEDAFGTSIGRETIGLYSGGNVRGFSAIAAGNTRIDTLYFDQQYGPNARIRRSTNIRVGLSALGFPFPAPTGIVDYQLKKPGRKPSASIYASVDSWTGVSLELDAVLPISPTLSAGGGIALYRNEFYNATNSYQHVEGVSLLWTPAPGFELQPFWQRSQIYDDEIGANYIPAGPYLPPRIPRRRSFGPDWAEYEGVAFTYGGIGSAKLTDDLVLRGGLFRTGFDDSVAAANLYLGVTRDGAAEQLVIIDPPGKTGSTSGELRLTRSIAEGPRIHLLHASARGRDRTRRYDGSAEIDLGSIRIGEVRDSTRPEFDFTEQTRDRVRQVTGGVAYEGRWKGVGEISLGVQKTDYRKRIALPGVAVTSTRSRPWLFNATFAAYLSPELAAYVGYVRGLEESGVAPARAANRNEALPAIRTSQRDAGIRWAVTKDIRLIAGVFDVRKPYFQLDENDIFALLGTIRNRGVELSLTGKLTPRLNLVAGAVLLDPQVTGEGVRLGRVGKRPVGLAKRTIRLNADWRPPIDDKLSLDIGVANSGRRPSTRDNLVSIPTRTLIDVGARYRIKLGDNPASLRLAVSNVFDTYGLELFGSGTYDTIPGRVATLSLAADF